MGLTTSKKNEGSRMLSAIIRARGIEEVRRKVLKSDNCVRYWASGRNKPGAEARIVLADAYAIPIGAWSEAPGSLSAPPPSPSQPQIGEMVSARELLHAQAERMLKRVLRLEERGGDASAVLEAEGALSGVLSRLARAEQRVMGRG